MSAVRIWYISHIDKIKATLGMLARGTEARKCGLTAEKVDGSCDSKIVSKYVIHAHADDATL